VSLDDRPGIPGKDVAVADVRISVDREGDWYYGEQRITREDLLASFFDNLTFRDGEGYFIEWHGQHCGIAVTDTPFVISRVDRGPSLSEDDPEIQLRIKHLERLEVLDPATLWVGDDHVLYCRVFEGRFTARFSRPAYYQLARWIEMDETGGGFFIQVRGRRYGIAGVGPE
jgi:hypothetical protein